MKFGRRKGVVYFLGNIHQHLNHALPLYRKTGGEFVVLSQKSYDFCKQQGVRVRMFNDCPDLFLQFDSKEVSETIEYLNRHTHAVIFYDIFTISKDIHGPTQIMLNHGNSFKDYLIDWRLKLIDRFAYIAGMGPVWKQTLIGAGVPEDRILEIGLARWDEIIQSAGQIKYRKEFEKTLDLDPGKPLVAYMPTWWGPSSVYTLGLEMLRYAPDECNLLFRPHPDTPSWLLGQYLELIKYKSNIRYVPEAEYKNITLAKMYAACDAFIGDMSSVMLDALLTDKPLMFGFDKTEHRQKDEVYKPIQEVFQASTKLTHDNIQHFGELLESALKKGTDPRAWQASKQRIFFGLRGDTVAKLAHLIKQL